MADAANTGASIEPWQVLETKYSYRDRWLALRSDTVRVPNGTILSPYHTIEFPEWTCVITLTPEQEIVLVEEYRHGVGHALLELPSGTHEDADGDMLTAAKRELLEETGYASPEWHTLGAFTANPARQNNRIHAFLALEARRVAHQKLDAGEIIRVHTVPWPQFDRDLSEGRLDMPGPHLAALWQLKTYARKKRDPRLLTLGL